MNAVSQQISQAMSQSEARFTAAYRRLESAGQISLSSNASTYIPPFSVSVQDVLSNSAQVTTNINGQEIALKGGGFLGGAALGTVLIPIPVFGTLIGGLIGGIVGALFTSTERKREKIREALVPEIDNFFAQLGDALENSINVYSSQVSTNVTRQIQAHVAKYKLIVQKVQEQRVIEQQSLQQFQQIIQNDLKEIKWRQSILQQKQQQLKENNSFR
jgi:gas vesicle protein